MTPGLKALVWWAGLAVLITLNIVLNVNLIVAASDGFLYGWLTAMAGYHMLPAFNR